LIQYRFSRACTLLAQDTLLQGAVISKGNAKLLKQQSAKGEPVYTKCNVLPKCFQYSERSTQLFCSFFNTHSAFFENGKRIVVYLAHRDRQAMACVNWSSYHFFQTVPPPRPITPYENKSTKKPNKRKKAMIKKPTAQQNAQNKKQNCLVM